jgi:hypothetical protein
MEHLIAQCTRWGDTMTEECAHNYTVVLTYLLPMLHLFAQSSIEVPKHYTAVVYCYAWTQPLIAHIDRLSRHNPSYLLVCNQWRAELDKFYHQLSYRMISVRTSLGTTAM